VSEVTNRLIAVGDVHGELESFQSVLKLEGLINDKNEWCGNETDTLLQIGDMMDRGPQSREAFHFIRDLQAQAKSARGEVIRLFGNHELMILQKYYAFCNFEDPEKLGEEIRTGIIEGKIQTAFSWNQRLYVHAGIRLGFLEKIRQDLNLGKIPWDDTYELITDYLNRVAREGVEAVDYKHPVFWVDASRGGQDAVGGVFWAHYPDLVAEGMNPLRQVVGHTPPEKQTKDPIRWTRDAKTINIDVGFYSGYGGNRGWLVADNEGITAKTVWKDKVSTKKIADK